MATGLFYRRLGVLLLDNNRGSEPTSSRKAKLSNCGDTLKLLLLRVDGDILSGAGNDSPTVKI